MPDISLSVDFDSAQFALAQNGKPFVCGLQDVGVRCRGKELRPLETWSKSCEYHENGCDYYEFDAPLTQDYRIQRFFLLHNTDRLFLLGDTLLWDGEKMPKPNRLPLEYEAKLVLAPKLSPAKNSKTPALELLNSAGRTLGRALPLALPELAGEWKIVRSEKLQSHSQYALKYCLQSSGISLFAPLVFDLDPARCKKPCLWRQLTVGENREKIPPDKAAGIHFRLDMRQLVMEQYLLYRSMTPPANRTVLGHNLIDDFCFARFSPASGVEALVEVQQE